jgi:rhodanese-related sulfurtransferase
MPKIVDTEQLRTLLDEGAQLVEVLPAEQYADEHLPGAVNLPLPELADRGDELDRGRPVILYCYDYQ